MPGPPGLIDAEEFNTTERGESESLSWGVLEPKWLWNLHTISEEVSPAKPALHMKPMVTRHYKLQEAKRPL